MKELYIDFDGVILDTIPHLYKAADDAGKERSDEKYYETFVFKTILFSSRSIISPFIIGSSIGFGQLIKQEKIIVKIKIAIKLCNFKRYITNIP